MKSGELGKSIVDLRQRVGTLENDKARLTQELADANKAREEKVREVSSTYDQLVAKMKGEIDKGQVTISELRGKLTVNMVEAILFDSGKAEIKQEGLVVLGKVIEILKTVNDKAIRIEGHGQQARRRSPHPALPDQLGAVGRARDQRRALSPETGHRAGRPVRRRLRRVQVGGRQRDTRGPRQESAHRDRPGTEGLIGRPRSPTAAENLLRAYGRPPVGPRLFQDRSPRRAPVVPAPPARRRRDMLCEPCFPIATRTRLSARLSSR